MHLIVPPLAHIEAPIIEFQLALSIFHPVFDHALVAAPSLDYHYYIL